MYYAIPVAGGARVMQGTSAQAKSHSTYAYPVPLNIRKGWDAGTYESSDLEIVGTGPKVTVQIKGVAYLCREVKAEIDAKTTELIMAGFVVEVGETEYTFSMASYAQTNLNTIAARFNAGQEVFPRKIRLLDEIETSPGVWKYYVTLTQASQLSTLLAAKQAHVDTNEGEGWSLKEQALAATDKATLEGIRSTNEARS